MRLLAFLPYENITVGGGGGGAWIDERLGFEIFE